MERQQQHTNQSSSKHRSLSGISRDVLETDGLLAAFLIGFVVFVPRSTGVDERRRSSLIGAIWGGGTVANPGKQINEIQSDLDGLESSLEASASFCFI